VTDLLASIFARKECDEMCEAKE